MNRKILFLLGISLLLFQKYILPIPTSLQFIIFLLGIIILGIPHGAADLLVATKNENRVSFSKIRFLINYLTRLILFGATLYFFPVIGNIIFIIFAAYHFGETDLNQFKTDKIIGKIFVTSYGLVILSIILLNHFEEVIPIFLYFKAGIDNISLINWIDTHRALLMSISGILFFTSTFVYFLQHNNLEEKNKEQFLTRFALLCCILFFMPMLLGFTFYFVVWHSVISLNNIVTYLKADVGNNSNKIIKDILLYSALALLGIGFFGFSAFFYTNTSAMSGYIFLGLAVLTAPHMGIMHSMYKSIRQTRVPQVNLE